MVSPIFSGFIWYYLTITLTWSNECFLCYSTIHLPPGSFFKFIFIIDRFELSSHYISYWKLYITLVLRTADSISAGLETFSYILTGGNFFLAWWCLGRTNWGLTETLLSIQPKSCEIAWDSQQKRTSLVRECVQATKFKYTYVYTKKKCWYNKFEIKNQQTFPILMKSNCGRGWWRCTQHPNHSAGARRSQFTEGPTETPWTIVAPSYWRV